MPRRYIQQAVPWRYPVDPGVVRNQDQSLLRCYGIRGVDLAGLSLAMQGSLMMRLNLAFQRLPGEWSIHIDRHRIMVRDLPIVEVDDPVLAACAEQRRREMLGSFDSEYFLTIRRRPVVPWNTLALEWLMTRPAAQRQVVELASEVRAFREHADHVAYLLSGVLSGCRPLQGKALATYLHRTVSDRWHDVAAVDLNQPLHYALCDAHFTPGWEPMLGAWHVAFCSVINFPHESRASLLERLDHLPFEHRQMTRWIAWPMSQSRKLFRGQENAWVSQQQSPLLHFMATQGYPSEVMDSHARNQAEDADAASQEVSGRYVGYGHFTSTVMVWGASVDEAETNIGHVRDLFEDEDFTVILETEHTEDAFRSMIPGDVTHSARRFPISSLNLAHLEPSLKGYWPGPTQDDDLKAPPWMLAHTEGASLFRIVNRVARHAAGHFAIIGPTGAGKSALLSFMAVSWLMQYGHLRSRVVCLDIGRSMRALALCLGAQYDDLTDGSTQFQPLADLATPQARRLRLEWLLDRCDHYDIPRTGITEPVLRTSLEDLSRVPVSQHTFKELSYLVSYKSSGAGQGITAVLGSDERTAGARATAKWEIQGQYKKINDMLESLAATGVLNGTSEHFSTHRLHVIEIGTLLDEMRLADAILPYAHERVRATFTGDPVLYLQDEHALQVTLPKQEDEAKRDLRSLRKQNASLGIATHDPVDLFETQMGMLIMNSCKTWFLLANAEAQTPEVAKAYGRLGCTETETAEIARMRPQGEYYLRQTYAQVARRRKFRVSLEGILLALCGSGSLEDHHHMDRILETHAPGVEFASAFFAWKAEQWRDPALAATAKSLRESPVNAVA